MTFAISFSFSFLPSHCLKSSPGLSGPSAMEFSPKYIPHHAQSSSTNSEASKYLVFISTTSKPSSHQSPRRSRSQSQSTESPIATSSTSSNERQLYILNLSNYHLKPLLNLPAKRRQESDHHMRSHSSSSLSSASSSSTGGINANNNSQSGSSDALTLEERLRRERQRMHSSGGLTQFCWTYNQKGVLRLLVPIRGSLYVQDGLDSHLRIVYDKHSMDQAVRSSKIIPTPPTSAIDPQLSPDGQLFAFCVMGEIFVGSCHECHPPIQITFGADLKEAITHGLADFVAQEEMDRYRGFWWSMDSKGIVFVRVDESKVPPYRITHHECETMSDSCTFEDHRYPFAGKANPSVRLAYVRVDSNSLTRQRKKQTAMSASSPSNSNSGPSTSSREAQKIAQRNWNEVKWFDPPREAAEYLARLDFLPDGFACAQWQNRTQNCLVLVRMNLETGKSRTLLVERSDVWINLHHLLHVLERPIHPHECQNTAFQPPLPNPLPEGSFSFLFGSERSGFSHLYLYTFVPGYNADQAMLVRQVSAGDWVVESIVGVSLQHNAVYVTGTYDSVLEKHLYALPIIIPVEGDFDQDTRPMDMEGSSLGHHPNGMRRGFKQVINALSGKSHNSSSGSGSNVSASNKRSSPTSVPPKSMSSATGQPVRLGMSATPVRLTGDSGMHNIVMDPNCCRVVDTSSDLGRPTTVKIFEIPEGGPFASFDSASRQSDDAAGDSGTGGPFFSRSRMCDMRLLYSLFDALRDDKSMEIAAYSPASLPAPELMTFPSSDGTESLHAALYRPDARIHGPGPYPLICAVYGGPHVQRVNRSWSQCADMRAQRLRSLGFCVVKCDNRGSSRRGIAFESAISRRLGRLEVLDQVAVVRQLCVRGIADPTRVGIYGWSYGGYLSAMCLCRAPDVFHVAVAGAPVTSWDGYDTHYTERYMGLPSENPSGYRESAVFDHVPNMRGKLLLVHGLIDENVHFRHTARLINRLIAAGKDYDLLLFPDERHSPRRLRDRIYMEQRISDYFLKHLSRPPLGGAATVRTIAGL
jgi:dipeptidyl aminopeptidase/acylaminoacyl peptidase